MTLTAEQTERYSRQLKLPEVGPEGQRKLLCSSVLVIGAGGLGSPIIIYLTAAGVGKIGVCDKDKVDISNLHRQIIHTTEGIGRPKTTSAKERAVALNPDVEIVEYQQFITEENAEDIFADYDFIIDATDNYATKAMINDVCVRMGKPFSHGAIREFEGQLFTYVPGSASYRDFYGEAPTNDEAPKAAQFGLFGVIAGIVGVLQAAECLKFLCGIEGLLTDRLLCIDARTMTFATLDAPKIICK